MRTAVVAAVMLDLLEVTDWAGEWVVVDWAATAVEEAAAALRRQRCEIKLRKR